MLAGVTDCRRSGKWSCRGKLSLGFKPRHSSHRERGPRGFGGEHRGPRGIGGEEKGPRGFGGVGEDHVALGCSLLPRGLGSRRDFAWKKRGERFLLVGHVKVPHGFGLTGDHGGDTADGAGSLNHGLLLLFLRYGTPG